MRTPVHHPKFDTLADFVAGRMDEARAVVVAAHAAQCDACSRAICDLEAIGGVMLESVEPVPMADDALEKILARADSAANIVAPAMADRDAWPERRPPLSDYLKDGLEDVKWRAVAPGLAQSVIKAQGYRDGVLRLLKIDPGTKMPRHTHKGEEVTLILRGAYEDETGAFGIGDFADLDADQTHSPMAVGDEPCICLIATSAPLAFKTIAGRIAQPFIGL